MELTLAAKAPHDIVFLDGSMTTPVIYLNQALARAAENPSLKMTNALKERAIGGMAAFLEILQSRRADKCFVFSPKYFHES